MPVRLDDAFYAGLDDRLAASDEARLRAYPGESGRRQPVHTAYVPADRYHRDVGSEWGAIAVAMMDEHLPDDAALADVVGIAPDLSGPVGRLVRAKLAAEPIEDLRIDFEDGYGPHTDAAEDADATRAAAELGRSIALGSAPPYVGIRFRCIEPGTRRRGLRTLDLFLDGLLALTELPPGFVVTLPKVTDVDQVEAFGSVCGVLERAHGLPVGRLRFEIQIETSQAVQSADGRATVARMIHAGSGRVSGLHYGTYDYSAACGVSASNQSLAHPVADHAKAVMQVAAAGTGVHLSDGSTNLVPVGGPEEIRAAWREHAGLVRRSLDRAFYQGWDLHPGQLVTRYAATYAFFRAGMPAAADRLRAYLGHIEGGVMDEPATAQAMAALLVRGLHSGALDPAEVMERTGVDVDVLNQLYRRRIGVA